MADCIINNEPHPATLSRLNWRVLESTCRAARQKRSFQEKEEAAELHGGAAWMMGPPSSK